jgi:uncharacterized protein
MKADSLVSFLARRSPVAVAFSGGVDSSLVAKAAYLADGRAIAVTARDISVAKKELENAKKIAKIIGITHIIVPIKHSEKFLRNDAMRCYHCKKATFRKIREVAGKHGITVLCDGNNYDDLGDDRPGLLAAREEGVLHPLIELKIGKAKVRALARSLSLPNYGKPASPCLSSRIPRGTRITSSALRRVEEAESYISRIAKVDVLRVRDSSGSARIEAGAGETGKILRERGRIVRKLKSLGYSRVLLDLEGYPER